MNNLEKDNPEQLYNEAVIIDALNVSNWDSPAVFESLQAGRVTAFNATIATWENYRETLDNIAAWLHQFEEYSGLVIVAQGNALVRCRKNNFSPVRASRMNSPQPYLPWRAPDRRKTIDEEMQS